MKKLVLFLLAVIAVQSYGIYGASQASRIVYTCELEVGPLCYHWSETTLSKTLGVKNAEKLEKKLAEAKKSFEKDFLEKFMNSDKSKLDKFFDSVTKGASEGFDKAKEAATKVLDKIEK